MWIPDAFAVFDPETFAVASVALAFRGRFLGVVLTGVVSLEQVGDFVVVLLHRVVRPRQLLHDLSATETEFDDFVAVDGVRDRPSDVLVVERRSLGV